MKSYLQVEDLSKSYGDRMLFAGVTFGVFEGDKIGLIAKNGSGKTTLLRILSGQEAPDGGNVVFANGIKVGFLDQVPQFADGDTPVTACAGAAAPGWEGEEKAKRMLTMLGVDDLAGEVSRMSGGQQKRVALARTLLQEPQLLILDEPTNHLDIGSVEWLENFLARSRMTLLMVTHDRYFLDRVCNKILEIDMQQVFSYEGNYDMYLRRRQERIDALTADAARAKNLLRKEQDWMSRQPQARAGKAKYRIDAFYDLKDRAAKRYDEKNVDTGGIQSSYIGSKIFEARGVSKRYGDKVILDGFTYTFGRYEKLGIVGANGVGKSTFIKMLQGLVAPDSGEWNVGQTVRFGYYSQEGLDMDPGKKVVDAVTQIAEEVRISDGVTLSPMQFLNRFLFTPADQQKYVGTLSGGERRRLHLATVLMRQPNFLILDEPTNDLDIVTLAILEDYLREFKGCVIVVSHDRFFLDSIVDHIFVMQGGGVVKDFPGNYTDYRRWLEQNRPEAAEAKGPERKPERTGQKQRPRKLTFKEKRELEALDAELEALNREKAELEAMFNAGGDPGKIAEAATRYSQVKELLDEKEMRWLELSEIEQ